MKVSTGSWHYRFIVWAWADSITSKVLPWWLRRKYDGNSSYTPPKSLCTYWWTLIGMLYFTPPLIALVWFITLLIIVPIAIRSLFTARAHLPGEPPRQSMPVEFFKSIKHRTCPIIEFVDKQED